jgi:hypothetical protein
MSREVSRSSISEMFVCCEQNEILQSATIYLQNGTTLNGRDLSCCSETVDVPCSICLLFVCSSIEWHGTNQCMSKGDDV